MQLDSSKNNLVQGEVLDSRPMMRVRLEDGSIVHVPGAEPKGSTIAIKCTDVTRTGQILHYEGYARVERAPKKKTASQKADSLQLSGAARPSLFA